MTIRQATYGWYYVTRISSRAVGNDFTKRALDLILACLCLLLFAPLMLFLVGLVRLDGGPGFFLHERIGRNGKPFKCIKLRSMAVDAEQRLAEILATDEQARAEWQRDQKLSRDPRVTRLGIILRKSSLDELPQLINVLKGEMSMVGPRPIVANEVSKYGRFVGYYYQCRPGITGMWQVSGRNDVSYRRRVALDCLYVRRWSLWVDLTILVRTAWVVIVAKGAS